MGTISVSDYWESFLQRIVKSGIRHSKAQIVSEALARHRTALEREMEAELQVRAEVKDRMETMK